MPVATTVRLDYPGSLLNRPLIHDLVRQFDLLTNILEAQVSSRGGYLIVMLHGDKGQVAQALAWVAAQGVQARTLSQVDVEPTGA
ncbi:MAG TPA: NIL domain-containing protein [Anaerolineae bacterium]|nr:NIL domain-containing protein [Anaerolineae bacterium]